MANILDHKTSERIKEIRRSDEYRSAAEAGWCCEGADDNCIAVFNWKAEEDKGYLSVNYLSDKIVTNQLAENVSLQDLMPFIRKECEIARLAYGVKANKEYAR